jgi:membrane dipeptidase
MGKAEEESYLTIHEKSVIVNGMDATGLDRLNFDYLQRLSDSGLTAFISAPSTEDNFVGAVRKLCDSYAILDKNADRLVHATSAGDIRGAKRSGKVAMIFGLQNAKPIEDNVNLLRIFHKLGVRVVQLTYQRRNLLGDGCGERTDCGLSHFGLKAVETMNELGLLIDLSHVGVTTTLEAIEISKDPVAFTHTCARDLCNHVRNKTADEIKAMAEKSGVMGISYLSHMVKPDGNVSGTTIDHYLDHIDYVVKLVGVDHVGVGFDYKEDRKREEWDRLPTVYPELSVKQPYDFQNLTVRDLKDIRGLSSITKGLVSRGYSGQDVSKILGGNFLRVFERVWRS